MDGREGMPSFYLNDGGVSGSGSHSGSGSQGDGLQVPPGFKTQANSKMSPDGHSNMRVGPMGSTYPVEHNPSPNFPHGVNIGVGDVGGDAVTAVSITTPRSGSDPDGKKKRGRPRKYGGDGSHIALALVPSSSVGDCPGSVTPTPKKNRGRP